MKSPLIWIGVALVAVGVFLPWVSVSTPLGGASKTGFEIHQGMISIGVGILGAILGFASSRRSESGKVFAGLTVLSALIVGAMCVSVLMEVARQSGGAGLPPELARHIRGSAEVGVLLSLAGGVLLFFGGLVALRSRQV